MPPLLEIKDFDDGIDTVREELKPLTEFPLTINSGQTLGIVGESGCGKTMLALSIMRLVPSGGKIINGEILFPVMIIKNITRRNACAPRQ